MLQPPELTLDSCAAPVQVTPPIRLTRDERVQARSLDPRGLRGTLSGRAAPLARATLLARALEARAARASALQGHGGSIRRSFYPLVRARSEAITAIAPPDSGSLHEFVPELDDSDEIDLDEVRDRLSAHEIRPAIVDQLEVLLQSMNFEYCLRTTLDQFGPEAADEDVSMALLLQWARLQGYLTDPDLTDADVEELREELVNFMNSTDVEELREELASLLNCAHANFPVPPRNARHFIWLARVGFRRWSTGAWAELRSRLYSLRAPRSLPRPLLVARRPTMRRPRSPATQRGPPAASDDDDPEPPPSRRLIALDLEHDLVRWIERLETEGMRQ